MLVFQTLYPELLMKQIDAEGIKPHDVTPSIPLDQPPLQPAAPTPQPSAPAAPLAPPTSPSTGGGSGSGGGRPIESHGMPLTYDGDSPQQLPPVTIDSTKTGSRPPWIAVAIIAVVLVAAILYVRSRRGR